MEPNNLITKIKSVEYFDQRRYKLTFLNNTVRWITSVTTKLTEYRERGIERWRESVGAEEADARFEEGGEMGSLVHHACFLRATGGAVLYEPPHYQTIGIPNEEVAALVKQNALVRRQLDLQKIPHITINDQFRFLQVRKFDYWMKTVQPKVLYAETTVYSLAEDIAGRIDFLFEVAGGNYPIAGAKDVFIPKGIILPDIKSGLWSDKYWLQLGAYAKAVGESLGIKVEATVGIHLKAATKTGLNTLVHQGEEVDQDFNDFKHVAAIYDRKHKNETPEPFEFESVLLGDDQAIGVILGATLDNPKAQEQVAQETILTVNKATTDAGLEGQLNASLAKEEAIKQGKREIAGLKIFEV